MNLLDEFQPIRDWAHERGIDTKGDPKTQCLKLTEEIGELAKAIIEGNRTDAEDAMGDMVVVLVNLATLHGSRLEDCINLAFMEIKNRKGQMENGTFIKAKPNE